jgi:hypothetical protein
MDQVLYVPEPVREGRTQKEMLADPDIGEHPYCQEGFVTARCRDGAHVFCRYFREPGSDELRTTANSEATPETNLIPWERRSQHIISEIFAHCYGSAKKE